MNTTTLQQLHLLLQEYESYFSTRLLLADLQKLKDVIRIVEQYPL